MRKRKRKHDDENEPVEGDGPLQDANDGGNDDANDATDESVPEHDELRHRRPRFPRDGHEQFLL